MRIIEIIPSLVSGGAERFVVDLSNELSVDHEVFLVVLYSLDDPIKSFYLRDVSKRVKIIELNKHKGFDFRLFFKLYRLIKKLAPDVVHTHMPGIVYIQLSLYLNRIPLYVHTVHNDAFKERGRDIINKMSRIRSFKSKRVIPVTISKESNESFKRCYGLPAPIIFNGRNIPSEISISNQVLKEFFNYRHSSNTKVIINLARVQSQKRQDLLARVAKRLEDEGYRFQILIIGRIHDDGMKHRIIDANCSKLLLLGEKDNPLEYLSLSDAYTLSSSHEGMPISLIEALGVGAIPICTPVGGCKDVIIDGVNGFLAKDISEEEYYVMLKRFMSLSTEEIKQMKIVSKRSYAKYSMTECANQYVTLFNRFMKWKK